MRLSSQLHDGSKTSKMHKEETLTRKVTYKNHFLNEISYNCGTQSMHKILDDSPKIFKLFKNNNVSQRMKNKVEYAQSTIDVGKVVFE